MEFTSSPEVAGGVQYRQWPSTRCVIKPLGGSLKTSGKTLLLLLWGSTTPFDGACR